MKLIKEKMIAIVGGALSYIIIQALMYTALVLFFEIKIIDSEDFLGYFLGTGIAMAFTLYSIVFLFILPSYIAAFIYVSRNSLEKYEQLCVNSVISSFLAVLIILILRDMITTENPLTSFFTNATCLFLIVVWSLISGVVGTKVYYEISRRKQ